MTTTYDELQELWKREFHNPELQSLRPGLFKDLSSYIKRLRESQKNLDAKSLKAIVLEEEMLRLEQLLTQFLDRRLDKLWLQTGLVQSTSLEYAEKLTHQAISGILRDYDKMKQDLLQGQEPSHSRPKNGEFVLIRFVKDGEADPSSNLRDPERLRQDETRSPSGPGTVSFKAKEWGICLDTVCKRRSINHRSRLEGARSISQGGRCEVAARKR